MGTISSYPLSRIPRSSGFTIVELLIVIVVIGILAAITIVAFNGVSNRAKVASIQADLTNDSKALKIENLTNGTYPATAALANGGQGLRTSNGTVIQYTANNAVSPATFCMTATNGSNTYFITQDTGYAVGACPGHVLINNGTSITNLATNPSLEVNTTGWTAVPGTSGVAAITNPTTNGGYYATHYGHLAWTTATTVISGGAYANVSTTPGSYATSLWVRSSKTQKVYLEMKYLKSDGTTVTGTFQSTAVVLAAGTWTNLSLTSTAPALTASVNIGVYASNTSGGALWLNGDYIDFDGLMVTTGATVYGFADGTLPNWTWSGTAGSSTSTGPAPQL